jgi:hypothetical protein
MLEIDDHGGLLFEDGNYLPFPPMQIKRVFVKSGLDALPPVATLPADVSSSRQFPREWP